MHFTSWVTFVRKLWINPCNICIFVCRGPSVDTWPCTSQFLKLGPEILTRDLNQAKTEVKVRCKKKKSDAIFPASSFSRNFGPAVGGRFFFFLHASLNMLLSLFQITCQHFRSKLQKLGVVLRYCPDQGLLPGPARSSPFFIAD